MRLSDELQRLGDHIHEAYEGRVQAVTAMRAELHAAHQEMAAALRRQLRDTERSRRGEAAEYVDNLRASVASMRASIASEMGGARRVWVELGERMRQARARVAVTPPAWVPERGVAVAPPKGRRRKGWLPD